MKNQYGNTTVVTAGILACVAFLIFVVATVAMVTVVQEHEYAIQIDDGKVAGVLTPGINFTAPLVSDVVRIPRTLQSREVSGIDASSVDNYGIHKTKIKFSYRIPKKSAKDLYLNYPNWDSVLSSAVNAVTKNVIGQYRMANIPKNRETISQQIRDGIQERAGDKLGIQIQDASLAYYGWGSDARTYMKSVKKAERQSDVEEEKFKTTKLKNERLDADAKAKNQRKIAASEAAAKAEINRAEAEAQALAEVAKVLADNPVLIERQRLKKWDGKLPVVSGSSENRISMGMSSLSQ